MAPHLFQQALHLQAPAVQTFHSIFSCIGHCPKEHRKKLGPIAVAIEVANEYRVGRRTKGMARVNTAQAADAGSAATAHEW